MIIDNEAGLEHLSRRTTRDVDVMFVVTDPTMRGIVAAKRIAEMRHELDVNIKQAYLLVNRVEGDLSPTLTAAIEQLDLPLGGMLAADRNITDLDAEGRPLVELDDDACIYRTVSDILQRL